MWHPLWTNCKCIYTCITKYKYKMQIHACRKCPLAHHFVFLQRATSNFDSLYLTVHRYWQYLFVGEEEKPHFRWKEMKASVKHTCLTDMLHWPFVWLKGIHFLFSPTERMASYHAIMCMTIRSERASTSHSHSSPLKHFNWIFLFI